MVECLGDPRLAAAVRSHHERWDGSGYPDGLSGERIPLEARIISVVDTFDALASARSYRTATPHVKVLRIIEEEAGRQFDPDAARAFISCYSDRRGVATWAAIASLPGRVAERLSIAPGEIAGVLGAALTAPLAVVAGAMAADTLPVTSDPLQNPPAISQPVAVIPEPAEELRPRRPPAPSTAPTAGTATPSAERVDTPPGEDKDRLQAQGRGSEPSEGDTAGAQATSTSSPSRDGVTASGSSEPPPSAPGPPVAAECRRSGAPGACQRSHSKAGGRRGPRRRSRPLSRPRRRSRADAHARGLGRSRPRPEPIVPEPTARAGAHPRAVTAAVGRDPARLPGVNADAADTQQGRLQERRLDGPRLPEPGAVHRRRQSP